MKIKLNDDDKQELIESFKQMLTVEITFEKQLIDGKISTSPDIVREDVFLPSFLIQVIKDVEGSNRGLQETLDKQAKEIATLNVKLNSMVGVLLALEKPILQIANSSPDQKILEYKDNKLYKIIAMIEDDGASDQEKETAKVIYKKLTGDDYVSTS